jgi:hypothetical protein
MPHVIVTADIANGREQPVTLRERIGTADLESNHFTARLVERLAWAVSDAHKRRAGLLAEQAHGQQSPLTEKTRSAGWCGPGHLFPEVMGRRCSQSSGRRSTRRCWPASKSTRSRTKSSTERRSTRNKDQLSGSTPRRSLSGHEANSRGTRLALNAIAPRAPSHEVATPRHRAMLDREHAHEHARSASRGIRMRVVIDQTSSEHRAPKRQGRDARAALTPSRDFSCPELVSVINVARVSPSAGLRRSRGRADRIGARRAAEHDLALRPDALEAAGAGDRLKRLHVGPLRSDLGVE